MPAETHRLDRWLWFARLFKSRSLAARAIAEGTVRLNRARVAKPGQTVRPGDVVTLMTATGPLVVRVLALGVRRGPPTEARNLYEPVPPRPQAAADCETKGAGHALPACP